MELPAVAAIDRIEITSYKLADPEARVRIALASNDAHTFTDAGTLTIGRTSDGAATLAGPLHARWLRFTFEHTPGAGMYIASLSALGSLTMPAFSFTGRWAYADSETGMNDRFFDGTKGTLAPNDRPVPREYEAATFETAGLLSGGTCMKNARVWRGPIVAASAQLGGSDVLNVVANGSLLVGVVDGQPFLARHIARAAKCDVAARGSGSNIVVVKRIPSLNGDEMNPQLVGNHRFRTIFLPALNAADLALARTLVLAYDCAANDDFSADQAKELLDFVRRGRVLVIRDADSCTKSDYRFIPYPFTTSAQGASGARGVSLILADSSALGSAASKDAAHYVDTKAYLASPNQQIGDADIMQTKDPHWCGLMFSKNRKGTSGWVHAYARYGAGVFIYNGFDVDDLEAHIAPAETISHLEYTFDPRTRLPCSARVALNPTGPPKTVAIPAKASLATQLEHGGHARTYGIHFDVASAHIEPQSEATIREIAAVLRAHATWHMRVEGHTDSDGGAADNLALSKARARAVVIDLQKKYGIAPDRLVAVGYGMTRPVASNATASGKALNRRVELDRM